MEMQMQTLQQLYSRGYAEAGMRALVAAEGGSACVPPPPHNERQRFYTCALTPFGDWTCVEGVHETAAALGPHVGITRLAAMPAWLPRTAIGDRMALRAQLWFPSVHVEPNAE